jgi:signal transduction histidine kinase
LFSLRGYLEGMETGVADTPEKRAYYLAVAKEKANALERLITDLFEYTRLEYLDLVPTREPLDLGALLRHTAEGMRPQAETKAVELALDGSPEPMEIEGDGHLLTRAVENLLDNALRHTPAGGVIRLGWHREAQKVVFSVSDTGPGIAPEDLPHLFAALYRGEGSRNRRTGGAGLGLTIAQRILIAHGGDLTAANQPSGGACFTASIPSSGTVTDVTGSNGATAAPSRVQERAPSR